MEGEVGRSQSQDQTTSSAEHDTNEMIECKRRTDHIIKLFLSGKPLFPRESLVALDRQFELGQETISVNDYDDTLRTYHSRSYPKDDRTRAIHYESIQYLTYRHMPDPPSFVAPLTITCVQYPPSSDYTVEHIARAFAEQAELWKHSRTIESLRRIFANVKWSAKIDSIIGFGLGDLDPSIAKVKVARAIWQHMAMRTMAEVLGEAFSCTVSCYVQDPAYTNADKSFLNSMGLTPLDDPKGFLEVTESTLVFSVSPNVPVKQIVADLPTWPAAMLWNTVDEDTPDQASQAMEEQTLYVDSSRFPYQLINDNTTFRLGFRPFTTDPDSSRVRSMVMQYDGQELEDHERRFGEMTLYTKAR